MSEDSKVVMTAWDAFSVVGFFMFCGFAIGVISFMAAVTVFPGVGWRHFEADRACRPGMVKEILPGSRALCVGGDEEVWEMSYD